MNRHACRRCLVPGRSMRRQHPPTGLKAQRIVCRRSLPQHTARAQLLGHCSSMLCHGINRHLGRNSLPPSTQHNCCHKVPAVWQQKRMRALG